MATTYGKTKYPGVRSYVGKDGKTEYEVAYRDVTKTVRTKRGFTNINKAKGYRDSQVGAKAEGRDTTVTATTMRQWWATYSAAKKWATNTRNTHEATAVHVMAALGDKRVVDVEPLDVEAMMTGMAAAGLAPSYVNKARGMVATLCKAAIHSPTFRGMGPNPCSAVKQHKAQKRKPRALTVDQVRVLLGLLPTWRLIVEVLAYAGLRPEEASGLRRSDVTIDGDRITAHVHQTTVEIGGTLEDRDVTKTYAERDVELFGMTPDARRELLAALKHMTPNARVFTPPGGGSFRSSGLGRAIDNAVSKHNTTAAERKVAPLPAITPYDLRHTCATILARAGVSQTTAAAFMGHDPAIFARLYVDVFATDKADAADAIRTAVGS